MKSFISNVPTLFLGLVVGALLPINQFLMKPNLLAGDSNFESRTSSLPVNFKPTAQSRAYASGSHSREGIFPSLDEVLNGPLQTGRHQLVVVEVSRNEGLENLLTSVFNWQCRAPGFQKDLVFYIAPIKSSPLEEQLIVNSLNNFLKKNILKYYQGEGKTAFLFQSREKVPAFSLEKILGKASHPDPLPYPSLTSQPIRGKIAQLFWIRTTISRWTLVLKNGIQFEGETIPVEQIKTFLVDPNRKLITAINLFTDISFYFRKTPG